MPKRLVVRPGTPTGESDPVWRLLENAVGFPTPAKMAAVRLDYASSSRRLVAFEIDGHLVAALGFIGDGSAVARMLHIAVAEHSRRMGIGRALVAWLDSQGFNTIMAETDLDAVGFYERVGFTATPTTSEYPNAQRFRCVLNLRDERSAKAPEGAS